MGSYYFLLSDQGSNLDSFGPKPNVLPITPSDILEFETYKYTFFLDVIKILLVSFIQLYLKMRTLKKNYKKIFLFVFFFCLCSIMVSMDFKPSIHKSKKKHFISWIVGQRTSNQFYFGTLAWHYKKKARNKHNLFTVLGGATYKGYCFYAFRNCYQKSSFFLGICRNWFTQKIGHSFEIAYGFCMGLVSGYDERLWSIAAYTPVLPYMSLSTHLNYKNIGIDISYSIYILLANITIRF